MNLAKCAAAAVVGMTLVGASASIARAEIGYATSNNKVYVTTTGMVAFLPTTGEFKSTPGGSDVPVCSGSSGFLILSQNSSGTVYADAVKDRFISLLMAAFLSGKKVNINFTRTSGNACYVDNVFFNT